MKYYLTGKTGGIGSSIYESLKEYDFTPDSGEEIDWLIFAHGITDETDPKRTLELNTLKCIEITQDFLPNLQQGVIYISSTAAITANSKFPVYSASKAALNCYAKAMAKAHPMLSFYAVCPGPTDTKMWRDLKLEGKAQPPSAVAEAVKQCIEGKFLSGSIITVRDSEIVCL